MPAKHQEILLSRSRSHRSRITIYFIWQACPLKIYCKPNNSGGKNLNGPENIVHDLVDILFIICLIEMPAVAGTVELNQSQLILQSYYENWQCGNNNGLYTGHEPPPQLNFSPSTIIWKIQRNTESEYLFLMLLILLFFNGIQRKYSHISKAVFHGRGWKILLLNKADTKASVATVWAALQSVSDGISWAKIWSEMSDKAPAFFLHFKCHQLRIPIFSIGQRWYCTDRLW